MKEIDNIEDFVAWANSSPESEPAAIQGLNLEGLAEAIISKSFPDSLFLSCEMHAPVGGHMVQSGGVVIPDLKGLDFSVHRKALYSAGELSAGFDINNPEGYKATYDFKVCRQYCRQGKTLAITIRWCSSGKSSSTMTKMPSTTCSRDVATPGLPLLASISKSSN